MNKKQIRPGRYRCPDCGSGRGLAYYEDSTHCFSCGAHTPYDVSGGPPPARVDNNYKKAILELTDLSTLKTLPIKERGLTQETVAKYEVGILLDEATGQPKAHYYPCYAKGRNPERLGSFIRTLPKDFRHEPAGQGINHRAALFGQQAFPPGCAKYITVTEGALDAMSGYQMFGGKFPFVSVVNGADAAVQDFKRNLDYLESFERVYNCNDRDWEKKATSSTTLRPRSTTKQIAGSVPTLRNISGPRRCSIQINFLDTSITPIRQADLCREKIDSRLLSTKPG